MVFPALFHKIKNIFKGYLRKTRSSSHTHPLNLVLTHSFWSSIQKYVDKFLSFIQKYWKFFFSLFIALLISDLLLIKSYHFLLSEKELPPLNLSPQRVYPNQSLALYKNIWENNIFHTGPIPSSLRGSETVSLEPVLSSLPFKLKGTIIHANPLRSVASISVGSDEKTLSYKQGEPIENQAKIRRIERAKVVFFNENNNRLEYIIIPEEKKPLHISYADTKPKPAVKSLVKRIGQNRFQVKRSDINDYLLKLPEILGQARVIPYRAQSGDIEGWRFASINKDSVFEKLGFEKGDILKNVNGQLIKTPEEALELFDKLKDSGGVKITVEKDGKDQDYEYNVDEDAPQL